MGEERRSPAGERGPAGKHGPAGERRHIWYIDYLRILAALSVVYMHTAAAALRAGVGPGHVTRGWHLLNLCTSLAFTAVPLFFMISGYLLLSDSAAARVDILLKRRLPRLLIPLTAWTAVTALWQAFRPGGDGLSGFLTLMRGALYGPIVTPLWFMYTMAAVYLMVPFLYAALHGLTPGGHRLVLGIIAAVSLKAMVRAFLPIGAEHYADLNLFAQLTSMGGYLLEMLLGWYVGNWKKKLPAGLLAGTAAGTYLLIVLGSWVRTAAHGEYDRGFQNQSGGFELLLACCLFLLARQYLDRPSRFLRTVPPLTLSIYLMHGLVLRVLEVRSVIPLRFPNVVTETAAIFVGGFLAAKTLASVPGLCYLFTGQRWKTACRSCNWIYTFRTWSAYLSRSRRAP